ncbi:hypothetical protein [Lactobacillus terrae]|uniref:hypothetical protein n=1 Tax=Lactobacillus terrae TaxID=2269374 RepID=UPI000C1B6CA5|nr:hypothetical protein [Lactobacillus terrae]
MKNLNKSYVKLIVPIIVVVIIVILFIFNAFQIRDKTADGISSISVPFSLIVNPKHIDEGVTPKGIKITDTNYEKTKKHVLELTDNIEANYLQTKRFSFLSANQEKQLKKMINSSQYQYIYSITLINFGKDTTGNYLTISCNQYNDTKKIVGYRYRLYYQGDSIKSAKYIKKLSDTTPPKYVYDDVAVRNTGIKQANSFMDSVKTAILNSNLTSTNAQNAGNFNQISTNLGLDPDYSNKGLYRFSKNANSRITNYAIIDYEITDVPRKTRIYIKQVNNGVSYYYTLSYNRNNNQFVSFQNGLISSTNTK